MFPLRFPCNPTECARIFRVLLCAMVLPAFAAGCGSDSGHQVLIPPSIAGEHFFFTHPEPEADAQEKEAARTAVLSALRGARVRIEVWCYGLNDREIIDQLVTAKHNGIPVSIFGSPDEDYREVERQGLSVQIRMHSGIQHVKVILVDRTTLVAGTGNFTKSDFFHNHNVFLVLPVSAASGDAIRNSLLHEDSPVPVRLPFQGGMLFSPGQGRVIQSVLAQAVLEAHEIRFMMFSHTDPVITAALASKVQSGALVEGIYDDASESGRLPDGTQAARLNESLGSHTAAIYLDGNRARFEAEPGAYHGGHLHHKTMIADGCVYTGSYNWSIGARDSNAEVFFRFCDAGVVDVFRREFDRVRARAVLIARPPTRANPGVLYFNDGRLCRSSGDASEAVVFSGKSAGFRAEVFAFPEGEVCVDPSKRGSASAGIQASVDFPLPIQAEAGRPANSTIDLAAAFSRHISDDLCPNGCATASLYRIHLSDGWIWLRSPTRYTRARFWTSNGLVALDLEADAEGFYRFAPGTVRGDSLIFLETTTGSIEAACVRTGRGVGKSLETWIRFREWETGEVTVCVEDER